MKIIVATEAGFCFGIKRALKLIDRLVEKGKRVQTIGPLIHNPEFLEFLSKKGIDSVSEPRYNLDQDTVYLIRTHGVAREVEEEMNRLGINYVDATCPLVKKNQLIISRQTQKKKRVVILGNPDHPEIIAARSYGKDVLVCNSLEEIERLPPAREYAAIAQTTLDAGFFSQAIAALCRKAEKLIVYSTICPASRKRQEEAAEISRQADLVIVIGGKNSSNTTKLAEISRMNCSRVIHIDRLEELSAELEKIEYQMIKTVGVLAGASTPQESIDQAIMIIKKFFKNKE